MEVTIVGLITTCLTYLGGLWLKGYFTTYFEEKAKLLAQKEDIAKVTLEIETVKTKLSHETEILKSGLLRLVNLETSHRNEERNCIIEFYSVYNLWLYSLMEINPGSYNRSNVKDLIDKRTHLEKFYKETGIAQAKIKLLIKDNEVIRLANELWYSLLKFKGWVDKELLSLQHAIEMQNHLLEEFLPIMKKYEENKERLIKIGDEERELRTQINVIVKEFYPNRLIEYEKVISIDVNFADEAKIYLTH